MTVIRSSMLTAMLILLCMWTVSCDSDSAVTVVEEEDNEFGMNGNGVSVSIDDRQDDAGNQDRFIATNEWQRVKRGQSIPKGLHVRMNLETNEVEAKLLDADEKQEDESMREERKRQMVDIGKSAEALNRGEIRLSREQIKDVLKNLKHDQGDMKDEKIRAESVKSKFRTMDELREEMKKMDMDLKSDQEIIARLWKKYTSADVTEREQLLILQDLEYYLHQYDNARDFANLGGLEVLTSDLNSTSVDIRREVAQVVASAVQSNPGVQIKAIEAGLMHQLIRLISMESNITVKSLVLTAVASLIRRFPYAQKKFLQLGGLDALAALFKKTGNERLQLKAVTLLGDLLNELNEYHDVPVDPLIANDNLQEKLRQYNEVGLRKALQDQHWCDWISSLLKLPEHDSREKVLATMTSVLDICKRNFMNQISPLEALALEYKALSIEEGEDDNDDDYFGRMYRAVSEVLTEIKSAHDEL